MELTRPAYGSWEEFNRSFLAGRMFWQLDTKRFDQQKAEDDGGKCPAAAGHLAHQGRQPLAATSLLAGGGGDRGAATGRRHSLLSGRPARDASFCWR